MDDAVDALARIARRQLSESLDMKSTQAAPAAPDSQPAANSGAAPAEPERERKDLATLRNLTVLPHVEELDGALCLRARSETRYERLKPLGAGAMGEVSLVRDNDIGRSVAVKQLVKHARESGDIARFIQEIRTVGQLEHPNIVPLYDVSVNEQDQIFFVMKHIDGETLEEIIAKLEARDPSYLTRYTIDYRIEIFLGLLHALQYAHAKGILHRDIKPAAGIGCEVRRVGSCEDGLRTAW